MDSTPLRVALLLRPRAAKRLCRGATPTYIVLSGEFVPRGAGKLCVVVAAMASTSLPHRVTPGESCFTQGD